MSYLTVKLPTISLTLAKWSHLVLEKNMVSHLVLEGTRKVEDIMLTRYAAILLHKIGPHWKKSLKIKNQIMYSPHKFVENSCIELQEQN